MSVLGMLFCASAHLPLLCLTSYNVWYIIKCGTVGVSQEMTEHQSKYVTFEAVTVAFTHCVLISVSVAILPDSIHIITAYTIIIIGTRAVFIHNSAGTRALLRLVWPASRLTRTPLARRQWKCLIHQRDVTI